MRAGLNGREEMPFFRRAGFTLIELLVAVAIILILIAIALPNFLEAQIRAKVTRSRAELRTLSVAIESYRIDFRNYPLDDNVVPTPYHPAGGSEVDGADWYSLLVLTTPHKYLSQIPKDHFQEGNAIAYPEVPYAVYNYHEQNSLLNPSAAPSVGEIFKRFSLYWVVFGIGPDREWQVKKVRTESQIIQGILEARAGAPSFAYTPTNGTRSRGDIILSNGFLM